MLPSACEAASKAGDFLPKQQCLLGPSKLPLFVLERLCMLCLFTHEEAQALPVYLIFQEVLYCIAFL